MADLKYQHISVKFCFRLGKTALETHEIFKDTFGENAMAEKSLLNGFLDSNDGKLLLDIVRVQAVSPQLAPKKTWKDFAKLAKKTNKVPFWRCLALLGLLHITCQ